MNKILIFLMSAFMFSCTSSESISPELKKSLELSGENRAEIEKALNHFEGEKKEAIEFLVEFMPERDLKELKADFLIENINLAYKAKEKYSWAQKIEKDIFFNEVLPYAALNERRDNWRADFLTRFSPYVENSETIEEAIWAVNNSILKELNVEYNTDRDKPDQSPYESMEQGMASCSGLSILLVDAFRAVGIPARVAGTPNWFNNSGNHNWVEVYVNGKWHFTEYYPSGKFDEAWFLERAGKADRENKEQWMYASSFKKTDMHFPLVWDDSITYVHALNVTDRYIDLYQKSLSPQDDNSINIQIVMLKGKDCSISGNNRVKSDVELILNGDVVEKGSTSGPNDDMNNYLTFSLDKNGEYFVKFNNHKGHPIIEKVDLNSEKQLILYHNQEL